MQVYFLGQYVKQTGHSGYKMQKSMENVSESPKFRAL